MLLRRFIGIFDVAVVSASAGVTVDSSALSTGYAGLGKSSDEADIELFTYLAYIFAVVGLIYLTIIILMRKNIKIAVAIMKETSKAVGKYSKRRRSNVAVITDRIIFISLFLFYCLLLNHSFPTNPNKITNCFKLILFLFQLYNYIAPASLF